MKNVSLKQLRYFEALTRHGHFGRAAEVCAVSQPALSVQIRDLELAFGAPLFERGARQVRATPLAMALAPRVRDILRAVDDLGDMARAAQDGLVGQFRLGIIPTIAPYLLPRLMSCLGDKFPDLEISVRETLTDRLLGELRDGRLDAAILALPIEDRSLAMAALLEESLLLVRPGRDKGAPAPTREALRDLRLLLLEEGHCFRDHALSFCDMDKGQRRDGLEGTSLSTLVQMVGAGIGVTLIPEMAVDVETRSADVSVSRFADAPPGRTVGMVWRRASPMAARLQGIADTLRVGLEQAPKGPKIRGL